MAQPQAETKSLKTSVDIYNRLKWDDSLDLDKSLIEILYPRKNLADQAKFGRLKSTAFSAWTPIEKGGNIPYHKIEQFKYNGLILWDREHRIDNINTNSGQTTMDLDQIRNSVQSTASIPEPDDRSKRGRKRKKRGNHSSKSTNSNLNLNEEMKTNNTNARDDDDDDDDHLEYYGDPLSISEFEADSQFLDLLLREPKTTRSLYHFLDTMMEDTFQCQRPNALEQMARNLCFKYLSFIECIKSCQYQRFGSSLIALDSHCSDIDVKITPSDPKSVSTRKGTLQLLTSMKRQLLRIEPLRYRISRESKSKSESKQENGVKQSHSTLRSLSLCDFEGDPIHQSMLDLEEMINSFDSISIELPQSDDNNKTNKKNNSSNDPIISMMVTVQKVEVREGTIPRNIVTFMVMAYSVNDEISRCTVSMDIVMNTNATNHDEIRTRNLVNWMNRHCIKSNDDRIHRYLFAVKQWVQYFGINSSVKSTINGYGWVHIAMFILIRDFRDQQSHSKESDELIEFVDVTSIYPNVTVPDNVSAAKLMVLFIEMLFHWICSDVDSDSKDSKKCQSRMYRGMDIVKGQWVENALKFSLFVVDPFSENALRPGNLAKCVRDRRGIPLLKNAIRKSVQCLQFAADEGRKGNKTGISKHIEFLSTTRESVGVGIEGEMELEFKDGVEMDLEHLSWTQLNSMNLGIPRRKWLKSTKSKKMNQSENEGINVNDNMNQQKEEDDGDDSDDELLTLAQFNCLAQDLTVGDSPKTTFRCDAKYLKWHYRAPRILYEILQYEPDIVSLCEVDANHFDTFYEPNMDQHGYDGMFLCKNDPTKHGSKWAWSPSDGVALFWKRDNIKCHGRYNCVLGKPNRTYHVALGVRLSHLRSEEKQEFCVWTTHLKAGGNAKNEQWRVAQIKTLRYYMRKHSDDVPIVLMGDLNAHFEDIINHEKEMVPSKVYPALITGNIYQFEANKERKKSSKDSKRRGRPIESGDIKFESLWNDSERNSFSTWAGRMDRDVKCCLDYIMIGRWSKKDVLNEPERLFEVREVLDIWEEEEIEKFECRLPNEIYPSDHLLIAVKVAMKGLKRKDTGNEEKDGGNNDVDDWSDEQQSALEEALKQARSLPAEERWDAVAYMVPGKTKTECMERFKWIREQLVAQKK